MESTATTLHADLLGAGHLLITGGPGRGKTALVRHLVATSPDQPVTVIDPEGNGALPMRGHMTYIGGPYLGSGASLLAAVHRAFGNGGLLVVEHLLMLPPAVQATVLGAVRTRTSPTIVVTTQTPLVESSHFETRVLMTGPLCPSGTTWDRVFTGGAPDCDQYPPVTGRGYFQDTHHRIVGFRAPWVEAEQQQQQQQ